LELHLEINDPNDTSTCHNLESATNVSQNIISEVHKQVKRKHINC